MSNTLKQFSDRDGQQTLELAYNNVDASFASSGFLTAMVGRRITYSIVTTTNANDTERYAFSENGTALYTIDIVYTSSARTTANYYIRSA